MAYSQKYSKDPYIKKIFVWAYIFKIGAGIAFALIYNFYYNWGGDTFYYYLNSCRLGDVLFSNPKAYFMMFFDMVDKTNVSELPQTIEYFPYFRDPPVYAVHRFLSPFSVIGLKNYYLMNICLNVFLYILNWKFFIFLNKLFPEKTKLIAISVLFIPSVGFWGSGLLKDPFTLSFTFIFIIYFYRIFFEKRIKIKNILFLIIASYVIIKLKPYILYSALVSCFVWLAFSYLYKIKNQFIRVFVFPFVITIMAFVGIYVLSNVGSIVGGAYEDVDSMLAKAASTQYDLKQDYYHGSTFDIGNLEPTVESAVSIAPKAIIAGLYRPFIWEARSVVMLLSGLENLVLLVLTFYVILKGGIRFFFKQLFSSPFLIFCLLFSIIMALGIGLSTSNFGALVRFKIPMLPFFAMLWLFILDNYNTRKKLKNLV
ncbi:MAG: hypothetical protein LBQ22_07940 [Bacteroidales bacterium]|nr:hypothetical protein [Bacteroidales bacterium]